MNKKILSAKDPKAIQNFTEQIFLLQNFNIDTAKNGKRALEKLSKHALKFILLDINMPIIDELTCT